MEGFLTIRRSILLHSYIRIQLILQFRQIIPNELLAIMLLILVKPLVNDVFKKFYVSLTIL